MKRLFVVVTALTTASTGVALALSGPPPPPGGAAPPSLVGTYRTTLTRADVAKASNPAHLPAQRTWELVIVNDPYVGYPRALGLRPAGSGGDTVPFGVRGKRLNLQCLAGDAGAVVRGFGTYAWSRRGKTLRLRKLSEPCKDRDLRNRIAILTSEPWKKVK